MAGIEAGLLAEFLLRPKLVIRALFGTAVGDDAPAIAIFIIHHHPRRPLVMTFNAAPIIGLNSWRCWLAGW